MPTFMYVLKQETKGGRWSSDEREGTRREAVQAVIAGYLMGEARWAETPDGRFIYGLDAAGKVREGVR